MQWLERVTIPWLKQLVRDVLLDTARELGGQVEACASRQQRYGVHTTHRIFLLTPFYEFRIVKAAAFYLTQCKKYTPLAPAATRCSPSG